MNTANISTIVLGILSLLLVIAAVLLYKSNTESEKTLRSEIDGMNTKLTESAKSVGQVEELKRAVESQRTEVTIRDNQLLAARGENNRLTSELATAQAEANSARTSLTQQIATEKAASAQALIREKEACTGLIQSEKDRCADLIKKEK